MPGRNILKEDVAETYYHVYARGANKQKIFVDEADFVYFLSLLKRYLSHKNTKSLRGADYQKLYDDISLLAFCLMQNHFHLLLYQINEKAMTRLMRGVMSSYSAYFNKKYHRVGHLFESSYRASIISSETYMLHISRYIHMNPQDWLNYRYSSMTTYLGKVNRDWVEKSRVLSMYTSADDYVQFIKDYETERTDLENLKKELADK
jgi:REP element-mobilizing transposase RayT